MRIQSLDHLVLTVRDLQKTLAFYCGALGMEHVTFAGGARHAVRFGAQKLNLHEAARPIDPNVRHATPGSADICLLIEGPLESVLAELAEKGLAPLGPPGTRTGAMGPIRSIYLYDPDENLIELAERVG